MGNLPLPRGVDGPFEHLREELGFEDPTFPGRFAQIFWNIRMSDRSSCDVSVCFVPRNLDGFDFMENRNDQFLALCQGAFKDYGNSVHSWTGSTEEVAGLFGSICDAGFTQHSEFVRAVDEFSRLTEADWARNMRAAMRRSFPEDE